MIKISLSILTVYLIYYTGNILYDLFLKKEKDLYKEDTEEFSLSGISYQYEGSAQNVVIDDVENIRTPRSFSSSELIPISNEESEERPDLHYLKEKYESEQDMEEQEMVSKQDPKETENRSDPEIPTSGNEPSADKEQEFQKPAEVAHHSNISNKDIENSRIIEWKKMLNLSETLVQLVSNNDGHKVYQSTM